MARNSTIPLYDPIDDVRDAALIVGPYGHAGAYQSQAFDWVAKAKALLAVFRRTTLVLPEDCPVKPYQHWRAMLRAQDRDLMLLKISGDGRGEFLEDPLTRPLRER